MNRGNGNGGIAPKPAFREKGDAEDLDLGCIGTMKVDGNVAGDEVIIMNKNGGAKITVSASGLFLIVKTTFGALRVRNGKFELTTIESEEPSA